MTLEVPSSSVVRFGTFEVDLSAGELRKQGQRIKLQDQPFQVLTVLLQRPGNVITREELRAQIWAQDTFVDFDNSLNTAINKLREALGDSADNPCFIETLPRRGYRFLAPVTGDRLKKTVPAAPGRRLILIAAFAVLVAAAAAGGWYWHSRRLRVLTEKDTIVLGDFTNSTGDPVFDGTLREGLSVQLEQSPFLSLVSEEGIHQTLRMMGQPANARLTPEITREICQRTNTTTALHGSIAVIGTRYNLILKAVNCVNGDVLASVEAQGNDKSHVLDALSKAAAEMRRKLGESVASVQAHNTPLEQVTTPSLEALQAYTLALEADTAAPALALLQRATQLDPNFAMAYWLRGIDYSQINENDLAAQSSWKAFELRAGVSDRERLHIEADYYLLPLGDLTKAQRACELGARLYPRDPMFRGCLRLIFYDLGQHEAGLKESLEFRRVALDTPFESFAYHTIAHGHLFLNQLDKARAVVKEARTKSLDSALGSVPYEIAVVGGDTEEMARQLALAANKPELEDLLLALEGDTAAYSGHLGRAREFARKAVESAERTGERATAACYYAASALREALFGYTAEARREAANAKKRSSGRDVDYGVALALAYAGDDTQERALADELAKKYPEDTVVQFNYLPTLRAKLALSGANADKALETVRVAAAYELGVPAVGFYNWPNLYPVYVRGEAYLAAHQGREAAVEFQKILDHRGIVLNEPIGALAHLQLGRAYALQGDTAKSRGAYQDFLALWKDADPDIPILQQAKTEYAKLK